ncbi:MAG: type I DNA topoisomerase [Fusobacteria bacterium]|nr:type I DNA topoisomerase [Fusobacteriota bacterium]
MAKKLVIVESPSKAGTIKKILGADYEVVASYGHLRDLPITKMGVDVDKNFEPSYMTIRGKQVVIKKLKDLAKDSDIVYLASDPDREGEAIAWHVGHILNLDLNEPIRIEFNEITKSAVSSAIENCRKIDMNKVDAQQARRILDRLVGYKISPLLWQSIGQNTSAGRVQSVALKIICDLEDKIKAFIPEEYFEVVGEFSDKLKLDLHKINGKKVERIFEKTILDTLVSKTLKQEFEIISNKVSDKQNKPPLPLKTSTLQQLASSQLGFSVTKTMRVAQSLYEGVKLSDGETGLITYMRTDSQRVSNEAIAMAKSFIEKTYGKEYVGKYFNLKAKEGVQDAHEAIRPSEVYRTPEAIKSFLNNDQFRLYQLIWERFVVSQLANVKYKQQEIIVEFQAYQFRGIVNKIIFDGYYKVFKDEIDTRELLDLHGATQVILEKHHVKEGITKAPARLTEASLVKQLEIEGIGRPSTYAAIVTTLKDREYVEIEKKQFVPTALGFNVKEEMEKNFPKIMNIKFTAQMENELDEIAEGKLEWQKALGEFYGELSKSLSKYSKNIDTIKSEGIDTDLVCPACQKGMKLKTGRFGKFVECHDYPECKTRVKLPKTLLVSLESSSGPLILKDSVDLVELTKPPLVKATDVKCPQCQNIMEYKIGRFGPYLNCSSCKTNLSIPKAFHVDLDQEPIVLNEQFEAKKIHDDTLIDAAGPCDKCGGRFTIKNGRFGPFLACGNYPTCKNIRRIGEKK